MSNGVGEVRVDKINQRQSEVGNPNPPLVSQNLEVDVLSQRRGILRKTRFPIKFDQRQSKLRNLNPSSFSQNFEVDFLE